MKSQRPSRQSRGRSSPTLLKKKLIQTSTISVGFALLGQCEQQLSTAAEGFWYLHAANFKGPTYEAALMGAGLDFLEAAVSSESPAPDSFHGPIRPVPRIAIWTTGVGPGDTGPKFSADVMPLVDASPGF